MDNHEINVETPIKKTKKKPDAEILLDKQLEMKAKTRKTDFAILIAFCAFILFFGIMFFVMPDIQHSQTENRDLAQMPSLSFDRIISDFKRDIRLMTMTETEKEAYKKELGDDYKVFSEEIGKYYREQFPFREQLRVIKAAVEIGMFKQENNDIVFAGDYLVKKDSVDGEVQDEDGTTRNRTYEDAAETIKGNVHLLSVIEQSLPDGVDLRTAVAGRTVDVAKSKLPLLFPYEDTHADYYWDAYYTQAEEDNLTTIDLKNTLKEHFENGEYVYYKTDHHWTSLGAYYAYCEIMKSYGIEPYALEDFSRETYTTSFYGTTFAKAGAAFGGVDTIELFRYEGDTDHTTLISNDDTAFDTDDEELKKAVTELKGFYNQDAYRDLHDKYGVFIGSNDTGNSGNNAYTLITKNTGEKRQKLLLIKDSFGNSLVPFLARHFDLVVLDLRSLKGKDFTKYLDDPDLAHILITYNMETFMNNSVKNAAARIIPYYRQKAK